MEEWRPVVGWEGDFEISSLGRVRAITFRGRPMYCYLSGTLSRQGYLRVFLRRGNRHETAHVHVLVAKAFLGPRPEAHHIHHIDGVRTNNQETNLEYKTFMEHIGGHRTIMTPEEVCIAIYLRAELELTWREISEQLGFTDCTIWNSVHRYMEREY